MKKIIAITVISAFFLIANIASAVKIVPIKYEPFPGPFTKVWEAINRLKSEVAKLWDAIENIELTPGPAGPQGEQGPSGPVGPTGGLKVIDADGKKVGYIINFDYDMINSPTVPGTEKFDKIDIIRVFDTNISKFSAYKMYDGSFWDKYPLLNDTLYFESEDCSSPPYSLFVKTPYILERFGSKVYSPKNWADIKEEKRFKSAIKIETPDYCRPMDETWFAAEMEEVTIPIYKGPLSIEIE